MVINLLVGPAGISHYLHGVRGLLNVLGQAPVGHSKLVAGVGGTELGATSDTVPRPAYRRVRYSYNILSPRSNRARIDGNSK